jgi:hypothetical protein
VILDLQRSFAPADQMYRFARGMRVLQPAFWKSKNGAPKQALRLSTSLSNQFIRFAINSFC